MEMTESTPTAPMLEAVNLYRFFHADDEETLALRGVSFKLEQGELLMVTGPSGSGKTTLLSCLAGLDEPDGGMVKLMGERISRQSEEYRARARARWLGVLFQSANLIGHLSVADNVALAHRLGEQRAADGDDVLELCGIAHRARSLPAQLSGGELARAGLAVALANRPTVLIADEPTGELDSVAASGVVALMRRLTDDGSAVLVATHSDEVADAADRRIHLHDGRIEP